MPDWSYSGSSVPITWLDLSGAFDASLVNNNAPLFLPQVLETTLVVCGAEFDRVVETFTYFSDGSLSLDIPRILLLCMNLPKKSSNVAQSRLEMLWRTSIVDYDVHAPAGAQETPAPETLRN